MGFPAEVRTEVYDGIIGYAESGTLPELKPLAKMAALFIIKDMDYINKRYGELSDKRRAAANARWGKEQNDANSCKNMQNDANSCKPMQPMLNMNMNMNNKYIYTHTNAQERECVGVEFFEECCTRFLSDEERNWQEQIFAKYGITDLAGAFSEFKGILIERDLLDKIEDSQDFCTKFVYLYCAKLNQKAKKTKKAKKNGTYDREEVRRYVAERLAMGDVPEPDISEDY